MDIVEFEARPGVGWVDGKRVPADRIVRLTETQARFDLEQGRIERRAARRGRDAGTAGEAATG